MCKAIVILSLLFKGQSVITTKTTKKKERQTASSQREEWAGNSGKDAGRAVC